MTGRIPQPSNVAQLAIYGMRHASRQPDEASPERGAILYDFLLVNGGAERVTLTLAHEYPDADLCVGSSAPLKFSSDFGVPRKLIDLRASSNIKVLRILKTLHAFAINTQFLDRYDWVLYSGVYAPAAVHNHPAGRNIHYCHTVPRYAYDLHDYYLRLSPSWQRPLLEKLIGLVKYHYESAIAKMDVIVANSETVRRRLAKYLNRDSIVVHPPCDTDRFSWSTQGDYYLSTARLEPLKRVDVIVNAFRNMPHRRLIVASGGSELRRLRLLASGHHNIVLLDWVTDDQLRTWMGNAIATIYIPKDEDFGISPVESMAAGKPVIGVAQGGLLETVIDGVTGILLPPDPAPEDIIAACTSLPPRRALAMRSDCEHQARRFGRDVFTTKMRSIIDGHKIDQNSPG